MPSALDLCGTMYQAIEVDRRLAKPGVSRTLKDTLTRVVADYNRLVTLRRHRVEVPKRNLIYNLFHVLKIKPTCNSCSNRNTSLQVNLKTDCISSALRLRAPEGFTEVLHRHYDLFPHSQSGLL